MFYTVNLYSFVYLLMLFNQFKLFLSGTLKIWPTVFISSLCAILCISVKASYLWFVPHPVIMTLTASTTLYHYSYRRELNLLRALKAMTGLAPTNPGKVQSSPNKDYKQDTIRPHCLWDAFHVKLDKSSLILNIQSLNLLLLGLIYVKVLLLNTSH